MDTAWCADVITLACIAHGASSVENDPLFNSWRILLMQELDENFVSFEREALRSPTQSFSFSSVCLSFLPWVGGSCDAYIHSSSLSYPQGQKKDDTAPMVPWELRAAYLEIIYSASFCWRTQLYGRVPKPSIPVRFRVSRTVQDRQITGPFDLNRKTCETLLNQN